MVCGIRSGSGFYWGSLDLPQGFSKGPKGFFRSEHLGFTVECARTYRPRKLSSVFCALVEGLCFAGLEIDFRGLCSDCALQTLFGGVCTHIRR